MDDMVGMVMGKVEGIKGTVGELKDKVFGKSAKKSLTDQCPHRGAGVYVLFTRGQRFQNNNFI